VSVAPRDLDSGWAQPRTASKNTIRWLELRRQGLLTNRTAADQTEAQGTIAADRAIDPRVDRSACELLVEGYALGRSAGRPAD